MMNYDRQIVTQRAMGMRMKPVMSARMMSNSTILTNSASSQESSGVGMRSVVASKNGSSIFITRIV